MTRKYGLFAGIAVLGAVLYGGTGGLTQGYYNDERHFWDASMRFAGAGWPNHDLLFSYSELNTPLPFMLFGWAENLLHWGIASGRFVNFLGGLAMLVLVAYTGRRRLVVAMIATGGLLLNPYFYVTTLYLYTDCVPIGLVLAGLYAYARGWHWLSAVLFGLAICGRQFMVVFPAGILLWEGLQLLQVTYNSRQVPAWARIRPLVAYGLACSVLLGWRIYWGDWAQPAEIAFQAIKTRRWHPEFGLYGLVCLAVYYVVPLELGNRLLPQQLRVSLPQPLPAHGMAFVALLSAGLCAYYVIEPTPQQIPYSLGPFERVLNGLLGGLPSVTYAKQIIYAVLIVVALRRLAQFSLPGIWLALHVALWAKAHVGWDKYTYPLVVVYWYLLVLPLPDSLERRHPTDWLRSKVPANRTAVPL